jgi:hypothetical protein
MGYSYQPLNEAIQEIRLLNISPGLDHEEIRCGLVHVPCLQQQLPKYVSLSYCWGKSDNSNTILVDGIRFVVTDNLYAALFEFRRQHYQLIWVDAICINQNDVHEKGHQILRMVDIYKYSQKTIAWLGSDGSGNAESAFNCLSKISQCSEDSQKARFKHLRNSMKQRHHLWKSSLGPFFALPYWKRTWIIQELALSPTVVIWWGKHPLTLDVLVPSLKKLCREYSVFRVLDGFAEVDCILKIRNLTEGVRKGTKCSSLSLHKALCLSSLSMTSEPLDKIFGVLGLCRDGRDLVPQPRYEQTLENLLHDMAISNLLHYKHMKGRLDSICVDNPSLPRRPELPSWVTDWTNTWQSLGASRLTYNKYKACGHSISNPKISTDRSTLSVNGYLFDTIHSMSVIECQEVHDHRTEFLKALYGKTEFDIPHNVYGAENNLYNAIWFSILDQCPSTPWSETMELVPCSWALKRLWSKSGKTILSKRSMGTKSRVCAIGSFLVYGRPLSEWAQYCDPDISPPKIKLPQKNILYHGAPATVNDILASFINALALFKLCRRILVTGMGYIGRAHKQACVDDSICLLEGCTVPVILRPCEGGYKLIGEAYVHGIMKGEFWKDQHKGTMQTFHLK